MVEFPSISNNIPGGKDNQPQSGPENLPEWANPENSWNKEKPKICDLDTPLESFFKGLTYLAGVVALFLFNEGVFGGKHSPPEPKMLKYIPLALMIGAISYFLKTRTNNYYIVNPRKRKIIYHFEFLDFGRESDYLDFADVHCVSVSGSLHRNKASSWYEYQLFVIDRSGVSHHLSDSVKEGRSEMNKKAKMVASAIGCDFFECPDSHKMVIELGLGQRYMVRFEEIKGNFSAMGYGKSVSILVGFVLCVIFAFILMASK